MIRPIQARTALDDDVYLLSLADLGDLDALLAGAELRVNGRPVTAVAPHPQLDDLVYVTTGDPRTLDFLPDDAFEIRP